MMDKTFCGLGLKAGVKLVLWIHLIENLVVFIMTALSVFNIDSLDSEEFSKYKAVLLYQVEFQNHLMPGLRKQPWWSFSLMFPLAGALISAPCFFFEKSKTLKVIWLIHQGFSVLLLFTTLTSFITSHTLVGSDKASLSLVFIPFIVFKFYSWLVIEASISLIRQEERKEKFGPQWITNSLMYAPSNLRLSLPVVIPNNVVEPYERF